MNKIKDSIPFNGENSSNSPSKSRMCKSRVDLRHDNISSVDNYDRKETNRYRDTISNNNSNNRSLKTD